MTVTADADSAKIHIANGAKVKTLTLHAAVEVTGKGTIEKAIIHAKGSRFEQEPWQIELADGVTVEVAGKMINESTRPAFIGGLGGRSSKGQTSKKVVKIEAIHDVWLLKGDDKDISVIGTRKRLGFTAASSDPSVVEAVYQLRETGEKIITATGLAVGSATVTVDVYQDGYKDATETFTVTVLQTIEVVENETVKFESAGGLELDHLPGGAKIGATLVEVKGVEAAGPIVNIIYDGVVPEDGVVVRLPVQTENAGLYFYNEDDGTRELQEGSKIVEIDGQRFVEATVYHFSIYGALVNTADLIANNIKHIADPDAGATVLKLPEMPSGFTVAIHYSSDTGVIAKDGTITPPAKDTTVTLVLEVTREADGSSAKTSEFKVKIPGIDPGVDPGVDSYTLEFVANPADAVTRLTYQIGDGEELEVIDNKIEVPANTESLALYAYSLDGKSMINWDVEGFGGFYVTHKGGVLNNEKDSLHLHGGRIENDSTVHFNYVNTPDMYRSEFRFTPGAPGTKSFDAVIEVRDANGDPIVGIGPSNIGLILYTDYNQPNVLSLSNFFNYPNFNGVKVTNMDDDFSDHVFSFTVTFTEEGIDEKDNNQNLFTHVGHGDKLEFDLRILQVLREGFTVDLPTEGDSE